MELCKSALFDISIETENYVNQAHFSEREAERCLEKGNIEEAIRKLQEASNFFSSSLNEVKCPRGKFVLEEQLHTTYQRIRLYDRLLAAEKERRSRLGSDPNSRTIAKVVRLEAGADYYPVVTPESTHDLSNYSLPFEISSNMAAMDSLLYLPPSNNRKTVLSWNSGKFVDGRKLNKTTDEARVAEIKERNFVLQAEISSASLKYDELSRAVAAVLKERNDFQQQSMLLSKELEELQHRMGSPPVFKLTDDSHAN